MACAPALSIRNLSKSFLGQRALSAVSLEIQAGEIQALVGENGSGKSTLIKCLAGVYEPDFEPPATIEIAGTELSIPYTSAEVAACGVGFVHQDLGLVPTLSVLENIALTSGFKTRAGRIQWRSESTRAAQLLEVFGAEFSPSTLVSGLTPAQRTLVAIARGLQGADAGGRLLVLDEPTAALPAGESQALFDVLRRVKALGVGVLYVSHRLDEIFAIADRVTVLLDSRQVGTFRTDEIDEAGLVEKMLGKKLETYYPELVATTRADVLLRVEGLSGARVKDVSFTVRHGEVVGVAGLLGSGRSELARLLFGAQRHTSGTIELDGEALEGHDPRKAIKAGMAFVPQDRRAAGSHPTLRLAENIALSNVGMFARAGRILRRREQQEVGRLIDHFDIRPPEPDKVFQTFSGGNQQKAVLAKWMRLDPKLLLLDEPVQAVDVGASAEIFQHIERAAADGAGVLIIDSELENLCHLCDRVLVLRNGELIRVLEGDEMTADNILGLVYLRGAVA